MIKAWLKLVPWIISIIMTALVYHSMIITGAKIKHTEDLIRGNALHLESLSSRLEDVINIYNKGNK